MARIRSIHPEACDSEKLADLSDAAERLFWRLQTHCDDEGRCDDDPRIIRARCATLLDWTNDTVDGLLDEMAAVGLIVRYEVAGRRYLEVQQWPRFQSPQRPTKGARPGPDGRYSDPVRRGKAASPQAVGRVEPVDETRRGQVADASDTGDSRVTAGGERIGEDGRPPTGVGGSRGEGGTRPRGGRPRPFSEDRTAAPHSTVTALHSKLAEAEAKYGQVQQ